MNILFIKHFFCMIYGFYDTESVRIRALSLLGYFPIYVHKYMRIHNTINSNRSFKMLYF